MSDWYWFFTHVTGPVSQSIAESDYNEACTTGMALAHLRMLIHIFLNKDIDIVLEEAHIILFDKRSAFCMDNNGKYTKNTRHIYIRVHFVTNGEKWKIHKIGWCEGGLQLENIVTKNVGENDLNTRMKFIRVRINNWKRTLVQKG